VKILRFPFTQSILSILFICITPAWVGAHAELEASTPSAGSTISEMPSSISLTFGEDLISLSGEKVNSLALSDPSGAAVTLSAPTVTGGKISAKIESLGGEVFASGTYEITYRVVSADGHPISGSIPFLLSAEENSPSDTKTPTVTSQKEQPIEDSKPTSGMSITFLSIGILFAVLIGGFLLFRKK